MFDRLLRQNALAFVAMFLAISGVGVAALKLKPNSVKSKQIKDGTIKGVDVADNSLTGADIDEASLSGIQGPAGGQGPRGATGPQGVAGVNGADARADGANGGIGAQGAAGIGVANLGFVRSSLDTDGSVGNATATTVGKDGLALIAYADSTNLDLKVAHCADTACSAATATTLDGAGTNVGGDNSITIGADGLGLISYRDATNGDLKVAHCSNTACSTATLNTVDGVGAIVGADNSITIGADGLGLISYRDESALDLKVAHCSNTVCSAATVTTLDAATDLGRDGSITIGGDGLGLISYRENIPANDLKVAHCSNLLCDTATMSTVDAPGAVGVESSIATGSDGRGLISYQDNSNTDLKVAHCSNTNCTVVVATSIDTPGAVGRESAITIGNDGLGLIAYSDSSNSDLKVAHCSDLECTSATANSIDTAGTVGTQSSITIGPDGFALIAYRDGTNADLKAAHCSNTFCVPFFRRR